MGATTCDTSSTGIGLVVLAVPQIDGVLSVTNGTTSSTVSISIPSASEEYYYKAWLSDSATDPTESVTVPDVSGVTSWEGVTNATGGKTLTIQHTGSQHTWYMWIWFARMNTSGAITVGV